MRNIPTIQIHDKESLEGNPKNQNPVKNETNMIAQAMKESTGKIIISLSFRSTPKLVFINCQLRPNFPMKSCKQLMDN